MNIASMLEHQFNGGHTPDVGPESEDITFVAVTDVDNAIDQAMDAVGDAIDEILKGRDHSAVDVLVGRFTTSVRDRLRQQYMVAWEDLDPTSTPWPSCATTYTG